MAPRIGNNETAPAPAFTKYDVWAYIENGDVPDLFLDIINHDIMRAPVMVAKTGQIYDRQSLAQWSTTCLDKGAAAGIIDPNTNLDLGRNLKLKRVPELEKPLRAFRQAVNNELAFRGEPFLDEPLEVRDSLSRGCLRSCWAYCFGRD